MLFVRGGMTPPTPKRNTTMAQKNYDGQSPDDTRRRYAQSQGVPEDDERVKRYAGEPTTEIRARYVEDEDDERAPILEKVDAKVREAAEKYARSQGVDVTDERVVKYVKGLIGRTGDFGGRDQASMVGWRKK
jgi:hypothetical protein